MSDDATTPEEAENPMVGFIALAQILTIQQVQWSTGIGAGSGPGKGVSYDNIDADLKWQCL